MDWRSVVVVVPAPSAVDELGAGCAVVDVVLATVVVTAAAVVVVAGPTSRHRFLSSSAVVVHVIGTPVEVTPVAPAGEQNAPAVTTCCPLAWPARPAPPAKIRAANTIRRIIWQAFRS